MANPSRLTETEVDRIPGRSETDRLAAVRTALANERTLLAYVRTALALSGGGAGMISLLEAPAAHAFGWTLVVLGLVGLVVGLSRFRHVARELGSPGRDTNDGRR